MKAVEFTGLQNKTALEEFEDTDYFVTIYSSFSLKSPLIRGVTAYANFIHPLRQKLQAHFNFFRELGRPVTFCLFNENCTLFEVDTQKDLDDLYYYLTLSNPYKLEIKPTLKLVHEEINPRELALVYKVLDSTHSHREGVAVVIKEFNNEEYEQDGFTITPVCLPYKIPIDWVHDYTYLQGVYDLTNEVSIVRAIYYQAYTSDALKEEVEKKLGSGIPSVLIQFITEGVQ
jgi:hypothetical protein